MKIRKKTHEFSFRLTIEEAAHILPLLLNEVRFLNRELELASFDDDEMAMLAGKHDRLNCVCRRLAGALDKKCDDVIGSEPEFVHEIWENLNNDIL